MSLIPGATASIIAVSELTKRLKDGVVPSPYELASLQGELVEYYSKIGQEMSQKFKTKEHVRLKKVLNENEEFQKIRKAEEKKTLKEAEVEARLSIGEEWSKEIDAAAEYESYRIMLSSLREAIGHATMVLSLIKGYEKTDSQYVS